MKRWQVTETERKVLDRVLSEYLDARKHRTMALVTITANKARGDVVGDIIVTLARESLAANRATIRLCSELTHLLRRF